MDEVPEGAEDSGAGEGDDEGCAGGKRLKREDSGTPSALVQQTTQMSNSSLITLGKDENVDSGISGDKSESEDRKDDLSPEPQEKSQEGPQEETQGPHNEVINAAPSTSNNITFLLTIKKPLRGGYRNYRRQRTRAEGSSDSDDGSQSQDSDDDSTEENQEDQDESRPIVQEETRRLWPADGALNNLDSTDSDDDTNNSNNSNTENDEDLSADTDTYDGDHWTDVETNGADDMSDNPEYQTPSVLLKPKPKHNWFLMKELLNREMGLTIGPGRSTKGNVVFEQRYYGSLHTVYRLELMYKLEQHRGCVNSINFHPEGHLLASGSDDLSVVIWNWATNRALQVIRTGHKSNVFQSRFLYLNARSQLNIVTCARDGQVRLIQCPPSGGSGSSVVKRKLASHTRSAHKLHVSPGEPHIVLSCGEDGVVILSDVRSDYTSKLFSVREKGSPVPLYSIHGHPLDPREVVVAGRNREVRVYDRRKGTKPTATFCPSYFADHQDAENKKRTLGMSLYVTCAIYNHDGTEILASYNDDDIYLFNTTDDVYEKDSTKEGYTHRYSGHRNSATFKGVSFFGPRSEYVVSGSDCGNIYVWDRKTEAIVQWMPGDEGGVVNCIESHPQCPILASSGLDKDVKIWVPSNEKDPNYSGLKEVVKSNNQAQLRSPLFNDFLPTLYNAWSRNQEFSEEDSNTNSLFGGNIEFDGNVCTTF